jgi:two-component system, OmpR family, sensor histidine kinase MprB
MSLRRRIAAATALSVAAVAIAVGIVGYVSTRSHLIGEIKSELRARTAPYLRAHRGGALRLRPFAGRQGLSAGRQAAIPPGPALGGAPGYFQFVYPDGKVVAPIGGKAQLHVDARVLAVAKRESGSFFTTAKVRGIHAEVLTVSDPAGGYAVQVALPLTGTDSVLNGLLLPYGLLLGGGVLLGLLLGAAVSRSALAPIERFLRRSERVDVDREHPGRLEESGASELRRLAASFNRTLEALERSIEAQRGLVADASHELRTPIAALRSNIQIFLESDRLPPDDRTGLQRSIIDELDELTAVVADVMELARGAAPGSVREPVELDVLVREAVERARRRSPDIRFELDLEPTVIEAAAEQVARAVGNVIDNACKWSPAAGAIAVGLHDGILTVRDHGPGFDERDLEHVFDRFYRADDARRLPGSGLGLAIVKQAADAHDGDARALNADGGGALLEVSFGAPTVAPPDSEELQCG